MTPDAPSPVSPARLAGLVADEALREPGLRVGVDGPVAADAHALADAVATELAARALPVARVCADDFLRARSLRLERGADDPDSFLAGWYDLAALRREVLDPMAPGRDHRSWLPRLRNPVTDRPYREPHRHAPGPAVVVLDGRFLARWEIADAVDVRVHLEVTAAARARRVPAGERARVLPAWEEYLQWYDPAAGASLVVRYDRPSHPAVRTP
ncbi:MAG TPA: hypothetical protein VI248_11670 [Kineosporiaceae bacterium]